MKSIIQVVVLILLFACDSDEITPLTPNLVIETKVYDFGNNGDASDLRVDFRGQQQSKCCRIQNINIT